MSEPSLPGAQEQITFGTNTSPGSEIPQSDASSRGQYNCTSEIDKKSQTQALDKSDIPDTRLPTNGYRCIDEIKRKVGNPALEDHSEMHTAKSNAPSDTGAFNPQTDGEASDWSSVDSKLISRKRENRLFTGNHPAAFSGNLLEQSSPYAELAPST